MNLSGPVVLCALNARYSHTCLALRSLRAFAAGKGYTKRELILLAFSINDQPSAILQKLFSRQGAVYAFSCYIWNIQLVSHLSRSLKKILPDALILWGGPEAGAKARQHMTDNLSVDLIVRGEGEMAFADLLNGLDDPGIDRSDIPGLVWRDEAGQVIENPVGPLLPGDDWPLAYTSAELEKELVGRMIYYETSRGCPFSCSYCMSALDRTVRYRPLEQVFAHLDQFLEAGLRQVKLVDRTFNCDPSRAKKIWAYLIDRAGSDPATNFHFEVAGDLLDDASIDLLSQAPPGLIQLEIGVQTIHPEVLAAICRKTDIDRLARQVQKLRRAGSVHLHLDLIAGLPGETLAMFSESVDYILKLRPQQFQLGFLKVLPGSPMHETARKLGFAWADDPPYEILRSDAVTFSELCHLKAVEKMIDFYLNPGFIARAFGYLMNQTVRPWVFISGLAKFAQAGGWLDRPIKPADRCRLLFEYARTLSRIGQNQDLWTAFVDLLRLDYQLSGQKDQPDFLSFHENGTDPSNRELLRQAREQFKRRHPGCGRLRVDQLALDLDHFLASGKLRAGQTLVCLDLSGQRPVMLDKAGSHDLY